MYKLTIFFAIIAVAKAGFLQGNNHEAVIEESFSAPAALSYPSASFASFAAPAPIAFPAPSYAAPIIKTPAYAAPIGLPAPIYGAPAPIFRPSLAVAHQAPAPIFRPSLAVAHAPAPYYGAPAALPIESGYGGW